MLSHSVELIRSGKLRIRPGFKLIRSEFESIGITTSNKLFSNTAIMTHDFFTILLQNSMHACFTHVVNRHRSYVTLYHKPFVKSAKMILKYMPKRDSKVHWNVHILENSNNITLLHNYEVKWYILSKLRA